MGIPYASVYAVWRQHVGMPYVAAQDPPRPPVCLLRSLLRALNAACVRANALLPRLDVPLHVEAGGVP